MKKIFLHSLTIRIYHSVNTFIVALLTMTSIQLRAPDIALFGSYRSAVLFHKYAGYAMVASFIVWLGYSLLSGNLRRNYLIRRNDVANLFKQARFYLFGVFKGEMNPFVPSADAKFNGLQKIAYMSMMFIFTPVIIITGVLFSEILYFQSSIDLIFGGVRTLDAVHIAVSYVFHIYFIIHTYMAIFLGNTLFSHVKAIIFGYEEEADESEGSEIPDNSEEAHEDSLNNDSPLKDRQ
jgi:thiosulfate reductase cytochrome b subunit